MQKNSQHQAVGGAILAGGAGRRMHAYKPLVRLAQRPLIEHVLERARPQVEAMIIIANQDQAGLRQFDCPVLPDGVAAGSGPLAGIHSALNWYQTDFRAPALVAMFPADVPLFPGDLVARLMAARLTLGGQLLWCCCAGQPQPLFSLWSTSLLPEIREALDQGLHGPMQFFERLGSRCQAVNFDASHPLDFFNINTPEQLAMAAADPVFA